MKKLIEEFKKFICRGNVLDMAVGVTVATAFTAVVSAFTKAFISPLLALLTDGADLSDLKLVIRPEVLDAEGEVVKSEVSLLFGTFIGALLDFFIIALVLFFVLKTAAFLNKRAEKLADEVKENARKLTGELKENVEKLEAVRKVKAKFAKGEKADETPAVEETKTEEPAPAPVTNEEIVLLREIRDALIHKKDEDNK